MIQFGLEEDLAITRFGDTDKLEHFALYNVICQYGWVCKRHQLTILSNRKIVTWSTYANSNTKDFSTTLNFSQPYSRLSSDVQEGLQQPLNVRNEAGSAPPLVVRSGWPNALSCNNWRSPSAKPNDIWMKITIICRLSFDFSKFGFDRSKKKYHMTIFFSSPTDKTGRHFFPFKFWCFNFF